MAQLDVYANPDPQSAALYPYLLEVQVSLLKDLPTAVIVPLARPECIEGLALRGLNPRCEVAGDSLVAMVQELAAMRRRVLGTPVANLSCQREELMGALDMLFTGI